MWIDLASAEAREVERVGAKAAGVARLGQAGLPVPRGWCLPVEVEPRVDFRLDENWRRPLALLRARLASLPPSAELQAAVGALCAGEEGLLAVRSSAVGEDARFSGLLSSFLGVRGREALLNAIQACWLSRWSDSVVRYASGRGLDLQQLRMGVLVQRAISARAAGGAWSSDGQVRIEGTWGLGRGLAEAEVIPDVWASGQFTPGVKALVAELDRSGGETWRRVPEAQASQPCLEQATVEELTRLLQAAERMVDQPVEVEWAVDERRQPWLLQARPLSEVPTQGRAELPPADGCLEGLPASPGQVVGRARVVRDAADLLDLGAEAVLVADRLAPGSLAGISSLAGLVLEAGGTTSHAATLARKRGVPAVLGVRYATRLIAEGDEVLVDGDAGQVVVLAWK